MNIIRNDKNPLITKNDITPSRSDLQVVGVFNCGAVKIGKETILVCRVAEAALPTLNNFLVPIIDNDGEIKLKSYDKNDSSLDFSDPRIICDKKTGAVIALTSISHFRVARSYDGVNFTFSSKTLLSLNPSIESWGVEDPRITQIGEWFYITFTSVSPKGAYVSLLRTKDFENVERFGIILPPTNKDVVLFPEVINDSYWMLHRPSPSGIGKSEIWISESKDLMHWGKHEYFLSINSASRWQQKKIGPSVPPIKIKEGWLVIYHGVDSEENYSIGALLLDSHNPKRIIARTINPIMVPEMEYEKKGFFNNTVFPCGAWVEENDFKRILVIYYGASDSAICRADISVDEIIEAMH